MNFDEIMMELEPAGVMPRKMFGHRCLMVVGKGFAVDYDGDIVLKLPDPEREEALSLAGADLFEPGPGHRMKEWVHIPVAHNSEWPRFAAVSMEYVARLASNS